MALSIDRYIAIVYPLKKAVAISDFLFVMSVFCVIRSKAPRITRVYLAALQDLRVRPEPRPGRPLHQVGPRPAQLHPHQQERRIRRPGKPPIPFKDLHNYGFIRIWNHIDYEHHAKFAYYKQCQRTSSSTGWVISAVTLAQYLCWLPWISNAQYCLDR